MFLIINKRLNNLINLFAVFVISLNDAFGLQVSELVEVKANEALSVGVKFVVVKGIFLVIRDVSLHADVEFFQHLVLELQVVFELVDTKAEDAL